MSDHQTPARFHLLGHAAAVLIALALGATLFIGAVYAVASADSPKPHTHSHIQKGQPTAFWMRTPCAYEDSVNCYWDASGSGNHKGHSFYTVAVAGPKPQMVCVYYTQRRFAKTHDYCEGGVYGRTAAPAGDTKTIAHPDFDQDGFVE